ncbi:MAG: endo alpha-1,4 polygalactosaminidase [Maritimibacter sp.]
MTNPLSDVRSWLYHIGGLTGDELAAIGAHGADLVVVDQADDALIAFTPAQVQEMRGAGGKQVISYLSIGEAETYRPYWDASWDHTPPAWLGATNPEWDGNVKVAYWEQAWQDIVFDMVDDIVDAGFDGLYLDIIDAYYYWEETAPHLDPDHYRALMIDFVAAIKARAEARQADNGEAGADFAIIGQNGEDLAEFPEYLSVIDGIGKEDLYFYYPNGESEAFGAVPEGWLSGSQTLLTLAHDADVEIFVVEYVPEVNLSESIPTLQDELIFLKEIDAPLYLTDTRALDEIDLSFNTEGINLDLLPPEDLATAMTDVLSDLIVKLGAHPDAQHDPSANRLVLPPFALDEYRPRDITGLAPDVAAHRIGSDSGQGATPLDFASLEHLDTFVF